MNTKFSEKQKRIADLLYASLVYLTAAKIYMDDAEDNPDDYPELETYIDESGLPEQVDEGICIAADAIAGLYEIEEDDDGPVWQYQEKITNMSDKDAMRLIEGGSFNTSYPDKVHQDIIDLYESEEIL